MHSPPRSHSHRASALARIVVALALLAGIVAVGVVFLKPREEPWSPTHSAPKPVPAPRADVESLTAKVAQGDAAAMNALGKAYLKGDGVKPNSQKAADLFRQAAELGHPDAQVNLGALYDTGQGITQDYAEAIKWFKRAAEQNHPAAAYYLGSMYGAPRGVPLSIPESTKWYMRSAELGDELAQFNVAQRYQLGIGVKVDLVEAYKWYELSARGGVPDSAEARDKLKRTLSANQIKDALKRIESWKPATGKSATP